jgi:hypothetical protein
MGNRKPSVTSETAGGGWSGSTAGLSHSVEEVTERVQILNGYYNASTDYNYGINRTIPKQRRGICQENHRCQQHAVAGGDVGRQVVGRKYEPFDVPQRMRTQEWRRDRARSFDPRQGRCRRCP